MKRKRLDNWTPFAPAVIAAADIDSLPDALRQEVDPAVNKFWLNNRYQVCERQADLYLVETVSVTHLSIKRRDKTPVHDWRDLQRIKNEICGPEREAVELFPAESRLVDTANQYHLWVLPAGMNWPFGFTERLVTDEVLMDGSVQRPFECPPADLAERRNDFRRKMDAVNGKEKDHAS